MKLRRETMGVREQPKYDLPIIVVDTREKEPYQFRASATCLGAESAKLDAGDYSIKGFENLITIERKASLLELCGNLGRNRKRFEAELERMKDIKYKYVIIEDNWASIFAYKKYTKMKTSQIFGSIISLMIKYDVQFIFAQNRKTAQGITRSLLVKAHQYHMEGLV